MAGEVIERPAGVSPFLRARWRNLLTVTYQVPDDVLRPYLPQGCEFDRLEGSAVASFVAFDFRNTRVKGVWFPGFRDFPEVNLRFYLRHGSRRGVAFIREFVPRQLIALLARTIYNEPYRAVSMRSHTPVEGERLEVEHRFKAGGRQNRVSFQGRGLLSVPPDTSHQHFLGEQEWGFGRLRGGQVVRYRVTHPPWRTYAEVQAELDVDFAAVYGPPFARLNGARPYVIQVAEGSEIAVFHHQPAGAP